MQLPAPCSDNVRRPRVSTSFKIPTCSAPSHKKNANLIVPIDWLRSASAAWIKRVFIPDWRLLELFSHARFAQHGCAAILAQSRLPSVPPGTGQPFLFYRRGTMLLGSHGLPASRRYPSDPHNACSRCYCVAVGGAKEQMCRAWKDLCPPHADPSPLLED